MNSPVTNQIIDQTDNLFDSNLEVDQPENSDTNLANPATNIDTNPVPSPDINPSISHNPSLISSPDINFSISQNISLDPHPTTNQVLVITGMHRSDRKSVV